MASLSQLAPTVNPAQLDSSASSGAAEQPSAPPVPASATKRPALDDKDDDQSNPPTKKRQSRRGRSTLACEECRARKRRCDGNIPACDGCVKRSCQCLYSSEAQNRGWQT